MILKRRLLIVSFFLIVLAPLLTANDDLYFKHLSVRNGLSQINIISIYQDETGSMWFGSFEGLNRYNGQNFTVFPPSQDEKGLTQGEIMTICGNQKGSIYIVASHDLILYDSNKQKFTCILPKSVHDIAYHNDTLWILSDKQVLYYTECDKQIRTFSDVAIKDIKLKTTSIHVSDDHNIWIGTHQGVIKIPQSNPHHRELLLPDTRIRCFHKDRKENLWIGTEKNGAYKITPDNQIENYRHQANNQNSLANNDVRCILEDDFNQLWFGTFYGLSKYNMQENQWSSFIHEDNVSYSLSHSSIFSLYKDRQGGVWVGTYFGGINYFHPGNAQSRFYGANQNNPNALSFPFTGRMQEDSRHDLWICTEGGGLNYLNRETRQFTHYTNCTESSQGTGHNNLKCIWYQKETDKLYIGTHTKGVSVFDIKTRTFQTLKDHLGRDISLPNDIVIQMQHYKDRLIICTQGGIVAVDLKKRSIEPVSPHPDIREKLEHYTYETFFIDSKGRIWLAHGSGGVTCINLTTRETRRYASNPDRNNTIGKFKVGHILETQKGDLYFATKGSGLFKYQPQTDSFLCFSKENNLLMNNYCYYIAETPSHYLAVLHNKEMSYIDIETNELKHTYATSHMSFCQGSSIYFMQDGELFLGGVNGIMSLHDEKIQQMPDSHQLYFDKLIINNREVIPDDDSGILSQSISYSQQIHLNDNQNNIILEFATSNYNVLNNYRYEYKLEGFDKIWIPTNLHKIVYTNLDPGKYRLIVREIKNSSTNNHMIALDIVIRPPFYAHPFAFLTYALSILLIAYYLIRQAKLKASLTFERNEKDRIEKLNQAKLRFFTNISHEFRTPLTLIMGQIEYLLQLNKLSPAMHNRMLRIYKNADHMRDLISELLNFRKQEQGYLKLKVKYLNIIPFTKDIYISFYEYALKHHITYKFESVETEAYFWFDSTQMQKVVFNLLSNAFKYTKPEGMITVQIEVLSEQVNIRIKDTGIGIPQESINKIFDRFYQIDYQESHLSLGTGIGLALTKNIVELHHGSIQVESEIGKGSCFTVKVQAGNSHFTKEELEPVTALIAEVDRQSISFQEELPDEKTTEDTTLTDKPTILLVEDNQEMLNMLKEIFSPLYHTYTAGNGKEGFEMIDQIHPDIVLSDVMMPEMSGKEMCYKIKNSVNFSHIPVVLLTAQTSVEYTIEGYMYGADDYITKPFNTKVLLSRCNNLIKSRKALIEKFRNQQIPSIVGNAINQSDKELIDKATVIIKQNFDNLEFNMNTLATELGLGRNKLYVRMKEITGLTPNEYTLKMKLEESMFLLKNNPELNISEISDRVGFSSTQYFSKSFKAVYGMAPLSYRKS